MRNLVMDGYPAARVLGTDLRKEYIDIGLKDLYRDEDICQIHFFSSDIFDVPLHLEVAEDLAELNEVTHLKQLVGRVNHVYTGALFHLFDESTQCAIARRVARLMIRTGGRAIIFGRHQGKEREDVIPDVMSR